MAISDENGRSQFSIVQQCCRRTDKRMDYTDVLLLNFYRSIALSRFFSARWKNHYHSNYGKNIIFNWFMDKDMRIYELK